MLQDQFLLDNYTAELAGLKGKLSKVIAPSAFAELQRIATQCHEALASARESSAGATPVSSGTFEKLFEKLHCAVEAIPKAALWAPLHHNARYVPPSEFEIVAQHVCSSGDGGFTLPILLHGAPGLGKSALARALHDRYQSVRAPPAADTGCCHVRIAPLLRAHQAA